MSLLDRTPGGFIALANVILYSVVLVECWMLTTASIAAMVATLTLVIVVAALLCRWMLNLLGPEDHALDYEPKRVKAPVPAAAPITPARPRPVARRAALN
jgi:hypothetical protein